MTHIPPGVVINGSTADSVNWGHAPNFTALAFLLRHAFKALLVSYGIKTVSKRLAFTSTITQNNYSNHMATD